MNHHTERLFDVVGAGIGPANLSLGALVEPVGELQTRFFDRQEQFQWHAGLLFPEATIQVSFLKDLVTLADPTSPYSFLSFLSASGRLYRFLNANFARVTRHEFNQYFRWVASTLPNLEYGRTVHAIQCDAHSLIVDLGDEIVRTKNLVLGTGLVPFIPTCAYSHIGGTVFHAHQYLHQDFQPAGRRVAVIGGGQTSAEVIYHLLSDSAALPAELYWISRRSNFLPLDESPFTNELFTPRYSNYFFHLQSEQRSHLLKEQKLASDGVSFELLERIYQRLYELEFLQENEHVCLLQPHRELVGMHPASTGWTLELQDVLTSQKEILHVDAVILCTGFEYKLPEFLEPIVGRIAWNPESGFSIRQDFSIEWDAPPSLRIYVQNAARNQRGVADPNLSLLAWRSATIVNSMAGRAVYDLREANSVFGSLCMDSHNAPSTHERAVST